MASNVETARAYYEAAEGRDGAALLVLHPAVTLRLTEGLPGGLGGAYEGREAAFDALRRAAEAFGPLARPERFLSAEVLLGALNRLLRQIPGCRFGDRFSENSPRDKVRLNGQMSLGQSLLIGRAPSRTVL